MSSEELEISKGGQFSLAPRNLDEAVRFAEMMAQSNFVPKDLKGKPGDIIVAVAMGADIGLKPLQAIQNIAVINGRPSIWGDAAIALVKASPQCEWVKEGIRVGEQCLNKNSDGLEAWCSVKRRGQDPETRDFSKSDAIRAGLWDKDGTWKKYPKRMLQMRARSWALRDVFADILSGLNIREETQDFIDAIPEPIQEPVFVDTPEIIEEPEPTDNGADESSLLADDLTGEVIPPEDEDPSINGAAETPDSLFPQGA